jgi:MFS family permease
MSSRGFTHEERIVVVGSSLGTVFEWYDFYLYGSLAAIIAKQFFAGVDANTAFIFALLAFAAGFIVRPFGALFFGRFGDMVGRKHTFLVTIVIMGLSTFLVGCLPSYAQIGVLAPVALISLRILQGLALGGEYGGAATYVAEHAPINRRGYFTSWIQTTATLGLFLSLLVILGTRTYLGEAAFADWGWRVPFLLSAILLGISVYIRLAMSESPIFARLKKQGKESKSPLSESFGQWKNLKLVILALLGLTAGQAVVWYTGQFYALFFLTQTLKIDGATANILIAISLLIGTPFFIVFGSLSDKIGRKKIIMAGCIIAALTYFPIFKAITHYGNPKLEAAIASSPVAVTANPAECQFQFNPTGTKKFTAPCDVAKAQLALKSVNYENIVAKPGEKVSVKVGTKTFSPEDPAFADKLGAALTEAGYPSKAEPTEMNKPVLVGLLTILVIYVTMVYGPIAALLVEMFPTKIRYTSMSLPYHIGNGWFGGFLPTTAFALVALHGNIYYGLWYPIVVAIGTAVIGILFISEKPNVDLEK